MCQSLPVATTSGMITTKKGQEWSMVEKCNDTMYAVPLWLQYVVPAIVVVQSQSLPGLHQTAESQWNGTGQGIVL
jgi:hypothetical protein